MKIKVYFCDFDSFRDALNRYIFEKCFGVTVVHEDIWHADYVGIGSIADHVLLQLKDFYKSLWHLIRSKKRITFLSCGFGRPNDYYCSRIRFFKRMIFKRKVNILSLRGELSKEQIVSIDPSIDLSSMMLGDLGLLASYLIEEMPEKKYDLGICPHYADKDDIVFKKIQDENPNSIILNTMDDPIEFLKKINQCKCVISTGLHPLIVADSLGIPNAWCRISEKTTTRHKYYDYYSIFSLKPEPINLYEEKIDIRKVSENYQINFAEVQMIKNALYNHHKIFFDMLKNN